MLRIDLTPDQVDRFFRSAPSDNGEGCSVWTGRFTPDGYGKFYAQGHEFQAHRVSWTLAFGPIPDGQILDHTCRVKACVNVNHLRLSDAALNAQNWPLSPRNTSGYPGVTWHKGVEKWQATSRLGGTTVYLGLFTNAFDAYCAWREHRMSVATTPNKELFRMKESMHD